MTPMQLATEVTHAYEARDRDQHDRMLARLVVAATPPDPARLSRQQLQERRADLIAQLEAIQARLAA